MLAMRPQVLVLDEPTASLDPAGKATVFKVLADLRERHEMTIVMATQELEQIARFADRVIVLHQGQIRLDGPPQEVFGQVARLQEWGIGAPQIAELGHLLAQRTGRPHHFIELADAYRNLRRQARKLHMAKLGQPRVRAARGQARSVADEPQIIARQVSYTYPDGTAALRNVNLDIYPGEFVALLGPNGSGKTTLAKHLNGLLKPTQGQVIVEHQDTRTTRVAQLARSVGYAFQNPDHQIFAATVQDEIAFGPRLQELPDSIVVQRVAEALDRFRLIPYADLPPALLGYGQRRQVALAAVLAAHPQILILDEPTGGLDWRSQQELMEIVADFHALGRTVILITHDMRLMAEYAERAIVLLNGSIVFDDRPKVLFRRSAVLEQARLALPAVTRLAQRLEKYGMTPHVLTPAEFVAEWQARLLACKRKRGKVDRPAVGMRGEHGS